MLMASCISSLLCPDTSPGFGDLIIGCLRLMPLLLAMKKHSVSGEHCVLSSQDTSGNTCFSSLMADGASVTSLALDPNSSLWDRKLTCCPH